MDPLQRFNNINIRNTLLGFFGIPFGLENYSIKYKSKEAINAGFSYERMKGNIIFNIKSCKKCVISV